MTKIIPMFRGDHGQDMVVLPVDLSRPHRYMPDWKFMGYCECGRRVGSDYHGEDFKQRTVSYRAEYDA